MIRLARGLESFPKTYQGYLALAFMGAIGEAGSKPLYPRPPKNVSDKSSPALERHRG